MCRGEYEHLNSRVKQADGSQPTLYQTVRAQGIELFGTLFEDNAHYPAQPQDLRNWGASSSHAVTFPLVLDPGFKMGAFFDSDATPLNLLVDVRTMTIVSVTMGYSESYWAEVEKL